MGLVDEAHGHQQDAGPGHEVVVEVELEKGLLDGHLAAAGVHLGVLHFQLGPEADAVVELVAQEQDEAVEVDLLLVAAAVLAAQVVVVQLTVGTHHGGAAAAVAMGHAGGGGTGRGHLLQGLGGGLQPLHDLAVLRLQGLHFLLQVGFRGGGQGQGGTQECGHNHLTGFHFSIPSWQFDVQQKIDGRGLYGKRIQMQIILISNYEQGARKWRGPENGDAAARGGAPRRTRTRPGRRFRRA